MGDIEMPGKVRSLEFLAAESACREIIQAKIDCTDMRGGEDLSTIGKIFAKDVEYQFTPTSRAQGRTITGRDALAAHYATGVEAARQARWRHGVTNIQFTLVDPTHAKSRSTLWVYRLGREDEPLKLQSIQELHDEFVLEEDGAWRLSKRAHDVIVRR